MFTATIMFKSEEYQTFFGFNSIFTAYCSSNTLAEALNDITFKFVNHAINDDRHFGHQFINFYSQPSIIAHRGVTEALSIDASPFVGDLIDDVVNKFDNYSRFHSIDSFIEFVRVCWRFLNLSVFSLRITRN